MAVKVSGIDVIDNSRNLVNVGTVDGRDVSADGAKLDGIEAGADVTDTGNVNPLVDTHLNTSAATTGQYLGWSGTDYAWSTVSGYTDADVNTHLNTGTAASGEVLSWTGADYDWVTVVAGATDINGLSDAVSDGIQDGANVGLGVDALGSASNSRRHTAVGRYALNDVTSAYGNVGVGWSAAKGVTGGDTTAVGYFSMIGSSVATSGSGNTAIGALTGVNLSTGAYNFLGGYQAGTNLTTAVNTVFIGQQAGFAATSDSLSVGIGYRALYNLTGGGTSTAPLVAIGREAMLSATGANYDSVAVGSQALKNMTSGYQNTAVGGFAGGTITTGIQNTVIGQGFGGAGALTTGSNNTLLGNSAAPSSATVSNEITLGNSSITRFRIPGLQTAASNGDVLTYNSASGVMELQTPAGGGATDIDGLSDGYSDGSSVGLGTGALAADDGSTNRNTALGINAANTITSGQRNAVFGYGALVNGTTASYSTIIGAEAAGGTSFVTTGVYNTAIGAQAGYELTTGAENTFIGYLAGYNTATGSNNIGIGAWALSTASSALSGTHNTAIGSYAGQDLSSGANNFLGGYQAGTNLTTGSNNVALGNGTLDAATTGGRNIAIGQDAMGSGVATTALGDNIAIGYVAGQSITAGASNVAVGPVALYSATSASFNTAIGKNALASATGGSNTALGSLAGDNITSGQNNIVIGYAADASSATVSNEITLGDTSITRFRIPAAGIDNTSDALSGTTPSVDTGARDTYTLSTSGNTTFTFTGAPSSGQVGTFSLIVTAGGAHTLTWPASVDWAGGTAPDAPASGEKDIYTFMTVDGGTNWYGFLAGDAMA